MRPGTALALALGILACVAPNASRYAYEMPGPDASASGVHVLLIPPLNFNGVLPEELVSSAERVRREIASYLEDEYGLATLLPTFAGFHEQWSDCRRAAFEASLERPDASDAIFESSIAILAERYAAEQPFDAFVMANLVIENAPIVKERAQWDGVSRRVRWVNTGRYRMTAQSGSTTGVSLEVRIFDRAGTLVFHGRGGLDLIHQGNVLESKMELVDDPLSDRFNLREGIAIAFDPYLPL